MTYGSGDELVEIQGLNNHETELAVMADFGLPHYTWLPKSQLEDWPDEGENGEFLIPRWLAEEKGVI